jgi:hypothetical protein
MDGISIEGSGLSEEFKQKLRDAYVPTPDPPSFAQLAQEAVAVFGPAA